MIHAEALKEKNKLEFLKLALQYNHNHALSLMENVSATMFPQPALPSVPQQGALPSVSTTIVPTTIDILGEGQEDEEECNEDMVGDDSDGGY